MACALKRCVATMGVEAWTMLPARSTRAPSTCGGERLRAPKRRVEKNLVTDPTGVTTVDSTRSVAST